MATAGSAKTGKGSAKTGTGEGEDGQHGEDREGVGEDGEVGRRRREGGRGRRRQCRNARSGACRSKGVNVRQSSRMGAELSLSFSLSLSLSPSPSYSSSLSLSFSLSLSPSYSSFSISRPLSLSPLSISPSTLLLPAQVSLSLPYLSRVLAASAASACPRATCAATARAPSPAHPTAAAAPASRLIHSIAATFSTGSRGHVDGPPLGEQASKRAEESALGELIDSPLSSALSRTLSLRSRSSLSLSLCFRIKRFPRFRTSPHSRHFGRAELSCPTCKSHEAAALRSLPSCSLLPSYPLSLPFQPLLSVSSLSLAD